MEGSPVSHNAPRHKALALGVEPECVVGKDGTTNPTDVMEHLGFLERVMSV
jgi:hypothetical protein